MDAHDLDLCWAALAVAILSKRPKTPEAAFHLLEQPYKTPAKVREETIHMMELSSMGFTHQEIGELYGIGNDAVCQRIIRYTKETEKAWIRIKYKTAAPAGERPAPLDSGFIEIPDKEKNTWR